jgi:hypothetical protein
LKVSSLLTPPCSARSKRHDAAEGFGWRNPQLTWRPKRAG